MKCSICEKEAVGFVVTKTRLNFNSPKIIEAVLIAAQSSS